MWAFDTCLQSGTLRNICIMKYSMTENGALSLAQLVLMGCERVGKSADCDAELAYIKQRWGY